MPCVQIAIPEGVEQRPSNRKWEERGLRASDGIYALLQLNESGQLDFGQFE